MKRTFLALGILLGGCAPHDAEVDEPTRHWRTAALQSCEHRPGAGLDHLDCKPDPRGLLVDGWQPLGDAMDGGACNHVQVTAYQRPGWTLGVMSRCVCAGAVMDDWTEGDPDYLCDPMGVAILLPEPEGPCVRSRTCEVLGLCTDTVQGCAGELSVPMIDEIYPEEL